MEKKRNRLLLLYARSLVCVCMILILTHMYYTHILDRGSEGAFAGEEEEKENV